MGNNNIQIDDYLSEHFEITFGVPQGSILGPVLFNFYVNDLSDALPSTVKCHQYADDTTFYRHCKPSEFQNCNGARQVNHLVVTMQPSSQPEEDRS